MSNLEIKTLRLKDYRQYGGEQEIDLSTSSGRINIIEGQNGAGKSNLLNAITLCFYGEERHQGDSDEDLESLPFVTRSQLDELPQGESKTGFIEVELGTDSPEYIFRREFETYRVGDGFSNQVGDLKLRRRVGAEWKQPDNPNTHLNEVLPATVSDYFLFDGEDLDAFFEEGYTDRVQEAILDVSHIELLNRGLDHLQKVQTDIERTAGNLEGEAEEYREQKEDLQKELQETKNKLEETKQNIKNTNKEISRIDKKLQDISDEGVRELYNQRDDLQNEIQNHQEEVEEVQSKTVGLMIDAGPVVYSHEALDFTLDVFDDLSEKGQIPPKIQDWFIDELIDRGTCICGTDLSEDNEHVEQLREVQEEMSDVMEENLEGKSEIPTMVKIADEKVSKIRSNRERIAELRETIDDKDKRVKSIKDQLKNYDIPDEDDIDLEALEDQREQLKQQKTRLNKKQGRLEKEIEDLEDRIETVGTKLRRELEKQSRHQEVLKQLEFAEDSAEHLTNVKQSILTDIRESTEANLEQYFNELIWKNEEYDIVLHEDYSIEVLDPHGDNKIGSLSAGEKQVLALSFMAALTQISGFNAPILIDTPLGRISSEPKRRIAQNLPRYVENTQITFLMTDEEYTDEVQAMMKGTLANEYRLDFNESITTVKPYA